MRRNSENTPTKTSPAARYLSLVSGRISAARRDMPRLIEMGEKMAAPICAGGRFLVPRIASFWPSEFCGRAGGFMGISRGHGLRMMRRDVAYIALPVPSRRDEAKEHALRALLAGRPQVFVNGRQDELDTLPSSLVRRVAGFTGGAPADLGLYAFGRFNPLAGVRHFDQFLRGWTATGEMIGACTRAGKMPVIYMSVMFEGAFVRNASFVKQSNYEGGYGVPFFHENLFVPPLEPGYAGNSFLDSAEGHLRTLLAQQKILAQAGEWMAQARREKRRVWTVAVGHSYPEVLELPEDSDYPVEWGHHSSEPATALSAGLNSGDVVLFLGYRPGDVPAVRAALKRGIRFIHTSPYGKPQGLDPHPNYLWFDLPWRPGDASVDVPGYGVRILPMSSVCHTMAFFAILCEYADRMGWNP